MNIHWLKTFLRDEDGAVTVDWVVLTAAISFVAISVIASVRDASIDMSNGIGAAISRQEKLLDP